MYSQVPPNPPGSRKRARGWSPFACPSSGTVPALLSPVAAATVLLSRLLRLGNLLLLCAQGSRANRVQKPRAPQQPPSPPKLLEPPLLHPLRRSPVRLKRQGSPASRPSPAAAAARSSRPLRLGKSNGVTTSLQGRPLQCCWRQLHRGPRCPSPPAQVGEEAWRTQGARCKRQPSPRSPIPSVTGVGMAAWKRQQGGNYVQYEGY